ncbi:hypothetical protein [Paenibacillus hamazuiensis]|uniref:hypothetical protein n=1 Tax=Paenibacillus hamazuiensis TaxID=2936508 RepID=UPI00201028F9|nr:hypothetical protein [Paenibacillus hamazuiensis]
MAYAAELQTDKQIDDEVLHLPDIRFIEYCFTTFGLNRGIYNTIDSWMFDAGLREIVERRQAIVRFLAAARQDREAEPRRSLLKFGKGGLTKQLQQFVYRNSQGG